MKTIKNMLVNFKQYWYLMTQIISRDFKKKYKRSVLGVLWSLLYPVMMMAVMTVVFSHMFRFGSEGANYLVYLMTGIILWNYFSEATMGAMTSVVDNFTLINKVYIPKYVFPICKCLFSGINFLLTLIPWLGIIILTKFGLGDYPASINIYYLLIPFIFFFFFLFTLGIGLTISCLSVFLRDIFYIFGIVLTIWNYYTPVFYSLSILPENLQRIFMLNPLYQYINTIRDIVLYGKCPTMLTMGIIAMFGIASLGIGALIFKKNQDKFIYYI